jgi:hypothetical protein
MDLSLFVFSRILGIAATIVIAGFAIDYYHGHWRSTAPKSRT